jgi:hypothetical protein
MVQSKKVIALIVLPTLAPLPFGMDIESTMLDDDFVKEMAKISPSNTDIGQR